MIALYHRVMLLSTGKSIVCVCVLVSRGVLSVPSSHQFTRSSESDSLLGLFLQLLRDLYGDLRSTVSGCPQWLPRHMGSLSLWILVLVLSLCLGLVLGLQPLLLPAMAILLLGMPADASPQWQRAVEKLFPMLAVEPPSSSSSPSHTHSDAAPASAVDSQTESHKDNRKDLSGVWKRVRLVNYENFIGVQGAGFVQRRLAASMAMTHTISMDPDLTAFRLMEKGGPLDTDNTYQVGGPEITTKTIQVGGHNHCCVYACPAPCSPPRSL